MYIISAYIGIGKYHIADDATLISVAQRPANRVSVSNSLQCDIDKISNWCTRWGSVS